MNIYKAVDSYLQSELMSRSVKRNSIMHIKSCLEDLQRPLWSLYLVSN